MTMKRFVMYWALAGVLVPVTIVLVSRLQDGVFEWPDLAVILWPSSIMLMALEAIHQPWWWQIVVPAISIATNVVLYSTVGAVLWLFWRLFGRLFR